MRRNTRVTGNTAARRLKENSVTRTESEISVQGNDAKSYFYINELNGLRVVRLFT